MFKKVLCALTFLVVTSTTSLASNPANIPVVPSISAMQSLGVYAPQYGTVNVSSYVAGKNLGGGIFTWNPSSTAATDGCTVFTSNGVSTGRWIRQMTGYTLDYTQCGAIPDGSLSTPGTDNTVAFQNAENAAYTLRLKLTCSGTFNVGNTGASPTITMKPGVEHWGSGTAGTVTSNADNSPCSIVQPFILGTTVVGLFTNSATSSGTVLHFASTAGVQVGMIASDYPNSRLDPVAQVVSVTPTTVTLNTSVAATVNNGDEIIFLPILFSLQNPIGGNIVEAPKFFHMSLVGGGVIQLNNPTGGFTDTGSSQETFVNFILDHVNIMALDGAAGWGVQISKGNHGSFKDGLVDAFSNGFDAEGWDSFLLDQVAFQGSTARQVILRAHSTFGNEFTIRKGTFTALTPGGCTAVIDDAYQNSTIENNYFEVGNIGSCPIVAFNGGADAVFNYNRVSYPVGDVTNWLTFVDTTTSYENIEVLGNYTGGSGASGSVLFNNGNGVTRYKNGGTIYATIRHSGNFSEAGFPYNSVDPTTDIQYQPNINSIFTSGTTGLTPCPYCLTVSVQNGGFYSLDSVGSSNYIEFSSNSQNRVVSNGTYNLYVLAARPLGAGTNLYCAFTDGGTPGSYSSVSLTTTPTWYTIKSAVAITGAVGARCYADTLGTHLYSVEVGQ